LKDRRAAAMDTNMYYGWYSTAVVDGEAEDESRRVLLYFSYAQLN
jgi:hypothetical protein